MLSFSVLSFVAQMYFIFLLKFYCSLLCYMKYLLFLPEQPLPLNTASENISPPVLKNETKIDVRCLLASKRESLQPGTKETDLYSYFFSGQRDDFFSLCYFKSLKSFTWTKWVPIFTQKKARTLLFSLYGRESLFLKLFVQTYTSTLFSITVTHACF